VVEKINDITVGDYDCIVVSGSMLPSNRWAQFDYYMMMYEKGLIDQVEMLKKTELVDIEGVLNRHSQMQQLQSENQQLQAEIKKLSGDLQTAQREVVHADKRVEVEKFKTNLHKSAESVRASSQVNNQLAKNQLNMFGQNLDFEKKLASMKYQSKLQDSSRDY
jgi:cell division protein FtsB